MFVAAAAAAAVIGFAINRKITGKGGTVIHIMSHDCWTNKFFFKITQTKICDMLVKCVSIKIIKTYNETKTHQQQTFILKNQLEPLNVWGEEKSEDWPFKKCKMQKMTSARH